MPADVDIISCRRHYFIQEAARRPLWRKLAAYSAGEPCKTSAYCRLLWVMSAADNAMVG